MNAVNQDNKDNSVGRTAKASNSKHARLIIASALTAFWFFEIWFLSAYGLGFVDMKLNILFETLFGLTPLIVLVLLWTSIKSRWFLVPVSLVLMPIAIFFACGVMMLWKQDYFAVMFGGRSLRFDHNREFDAGNYQVDVLDYKAEGYRRIEVYKRRSVTPGVYKGQYITTVYPKGLVSLVGVSHNRLLIVGPLEGATTQKTLIDLGG